VLPAQYRPHISLAYGLEAQAVPNGLLEKLHKDFVGREVVLTHAVVVASAKGIPIEAWHRLVTLAL